MVEQDLAVRVVDDRLLDHRAGNDVLDLLRHNDGLTVVFADGLDVYKRQVCTLIEGAGAAGRCNRP